MNLRIAPEQLRFRLSAAEFATLAATGMLQSATQLTECCRLDYLIRVDTAASAPTGQALELSTSTTSTGPRFELTVFANGLQQLQSGGAGKDGIREHLAFANGDLLSIGLEIDLHSKKEGV